MYLGQQKDREIAYSEDLTEEEELDMLAAEQSNREVREEMEVGANGVSER